VTTGYANASASVGGGTGVRNAWFRFAVNEPGEAVVTLTPMGETSLALSLFDDSVVVKRSRTPVELGYRLVTSSPDSIATDVRPTVYYINVTTGPQAQRTDFVVAVTYRADARPAITAGSRPAAVAAAPSRPARSRTAPPRPSSEVTVIAPAPRAEIQEPPVPASAPPAPPTLVSPERREALPLSSGSTATVDVGGESGYRWRWYEVTLARKGKVRVDVTADGAAVEIELFDANGKKLNTLEVSGSATHSARHNAGKMFIRVGPATNDEASRVTVDLKVAVAPFIRQ
jgi:hypothetical protein